MAGLAVLGGLLVVPVGAMGSFGLGVGPFWVVGGGGGGGLWAVSKVESSARTSASLSEVYPDWKLQ